MIGLWVALAGGLGAAARFTLDGFLTQHSRRGLTIATLTINVLGSFLLGLLTGWAGHDGHELVRSIAGVGFLGGFTTFSTASVELVRLTRAERPLAAGGLAVAMIMLSLTMCLLGLTLGQLVG